MRDRMQRLRPELEDAGRRLGEAPADEGGGDRASGPLDERACSSFPTRGDEVRLP